MIVLAVLAGYLLGSVPSADWVARAAGLDLRRSGTGNPGTANAIGLGGMRVGVPILLLDFLKGMAAVGAGLALAGDGGAVAAGVAAVAGQVLNPWYGFRGGKGLAVGGGVALASFPAVTVAMLAVVAGLTRTVRPTALAVLVTLAAALALAAATTGAGAPWDWSALGGGHRLAVAVGLVAVVTPKLVADLADHRRAVRSGT